MGRMELVQKIAAENPHLVQSDVETIVNRTIQEIIGPASARPGDSVTQFAPLAAEPGASIAEQPSKDVLRRFLDFASTMSDKELDRSIDFLDPEVVQQVFEAAFDSLAWSAETLEAISRENRRFHDEFTSRSKEIEALNARNDARLRHLLES